MEQVEFRPLSVVLGIVAKRCKIGVCSYSLMLLVLSRGRQNLVGRAFRFFANKTRTYHFKVKTHPTTILFFTDWSLSPYSDDLQHRFQFTLPYANGAGWNFRPFRPFSRAAVLCMVAKRCSAKLVSGPAKLANICKILVFFSHWNCPYPNGALPWQQFEI